MAGGRYVGFDIGSFTTKAVEITGKGNKLTLSSAYMLSTPDDTIVDGTIIDYAELSKHINKVHTSGGFVSSAAALAVKGNNTIVKSVKIPYSNQEQLNKNLYFMADQYMNVDLEEYSIDYHILNINKTSAMAHVLYAANRNDALSDYISIFQSADIELKAVDIEAVALTNLYTYMQLSTNGASMILHIGKSSVYHIFLENGLFSYYETSGSGGNLASMVLMRQANIRQDDVEDTKAGLENAPNKEKMLDALNENYFPELTDEMEVAINNHMLMGGRPPEKVYLSGGGASIYGLREAIQKKFDVNSTIINPATQLTVTSPVAKQIMEQRPGILNVAIAMALR